MTGAYHDHSRARGNRPVAPATNTGPIDFGRRVAVLRLLGGRLSLRFDLRSLVTGVILLLSTAMIGAVSLASGKLNLNSDID